MRFHFVVLDAPRFDLLTSIVKVEEPVLAQAFHPYPRATILIFGWRCVRAAPSARLCHLGGSNGLGDRRGKGEDD
jgi:hypothetical protein